MIKGALLGAEALTRHVAEAGPRLTTNLTTSIARLTLSLLRRVKADKLSGQVLRVRTGRLRRSINSRIEGQGTTQVTGYVGTNVSYARPHEYGFTGKVAVRESLRMQVQAWGRPIEPQRVTVRAHMRQVTLPERSFLRSALMEMGPEIETQIKGAVTEAIK